MSDDFKLKDLMEQTFEQTGHTHKTFADALNEKLINTDINRVSVTNWANAKSMPKTDFLLLCAVVYRDYRSEWAKAALRIKLPEVFDSGMVTFNKAK
jgi:hypothetical protein